MKFSQILLLLLFYDIAPLRAYWIEVSVLDVLNASVITYLTVPADFGDDVPPMGLRGRIQETIPHNACQPLEPVTSLLSNNSRSLPWIALIESGENSKNCTFDLQVLHAQMAGYVAVILNSNMSDDLFVMSGGRYASQVVIPSVLISYEHFRALRDIWMLLPGYKVELMSNFFASIYLVPFLIVVSASLALTIVFIAVKWCREYYIRQRSKLSKRHLKKLAQKKFTASEDPYDCCAICLDDFVENDSLRILPCNHAYHMKCIDPWLLKNKRNCPVCKRKVFIGKKSTSFDLSVEENGIDTDSDEDSSSLASQPSTSNARINERTPLLLSVDAGQSISTFGTVSNTGESTEDHRDPNTL